METDGRTGGDGIVRKKNKYRLHLVSRVKLYKLEFTTTTKTSDLPAFTINRLGKFETFQKNIRDWLVIISHQSKFFSGSRDLLH